MLNIILPSLPYDRRLDPMWEEEADVARHHGHTLTLYDAEQQRLYAPPHPAYPSLYRGWMLTAPEYQQLAELTPLLVPLAEYTSSHWATGWYEAIAGYTPRSYFVPMEERGIVLTLVRRHGRCFVKGLSKSYGADSWVTSLADYDQLVAKHGLGPDDDLFVREEVKLSAQPEQRFFAVHGRVFGAGGQKFPPALAPVLAALSSRKFYTIDVATNTQDRPLVIEIGDGQVSDTKEWTVAELYETAVGRLAELAGGTGRAA